METFPAIDPDAERVLVFDLSNQLDPGEVLAGGAELLSLICTSGSDANANQIAVGPPSYDLTGTKILLPVGNLSERVNNTYEFEMGSATTEPNKFCVLRALLPVEIS